MMTDFPKLVRMAVRQLRRNPGFSFTAILTLAIGIGATTAIFSIFYAVLLRPLPYLDSARLVQAEPRVSLPNGAGVVENEVSYPDFRDWRDQQRVFDSMGSYHTNAIVLNTVSSGPARTLQAGVVSSDFMSVLRVTPALGRNFTRDEEKPGTRVAILSHELWMSDFQSSPAILGKTVRFSDELYTVVGVLPAKASFPMVATLPMDVWTTTAFDAVGKNPSTEQRGWSQLNVIARLKPGVSLAQATAQMDAVEHGLAVRYPDSDANAVGVKLTPSLAHLTGDVRRALQVLLTAVSALLLIACANVAGLLLARGASRQTEMAVRAALGATRKEITLQLLVEMLVLSLIGGAGGIVVAFLALQSMLRFVPRNLPRLDDVAINAPVLAFAIVASALTGILFGILPSRRLARLSPALALRDGTRSSTAGRKQNRLHAALVIGETALGLVLLVGAGLLIRSFVHMLHVDPGFNPQHMLTFRVGLSDKSYPEKRTTQFVDSLLARLDALPGARGSAAAFPMPFSGGNMSLDFSIEEHPTKPNEEPDARATVAQPGFFENLQIPMIEGRTFTQQDSREGAPSVAVINKALADKHFPHEDPIGRRIRTGFDETPDGKSTAWRTIVGVSANVKRLNINEAPEPEFFVPYAQAAVTPPYFALRVVGDPASYAQSVTRAVAEIDKEVPVYRIRSMEEGMAASSAEPRFQTLLLTAFAAIALLLAAIGLYAVLSYMVSQRTHELGLRMALGAQRGDVLSLVMLRGFKLTIIGLIAGGAMSVMLARYVASLLHGVDALDPLTYLIVAAMLLIVSGLASVIPAARAASLEPMETLRNQ